MRVLSQRHFSRSFVYALAGAALFAAFPFTAFAATITFTPASGTFAAGDPFSVQVGLDSGSDSVNASDGTISFDATLLKVSSISKDASAFSLWTADPSFDNSAGTVSYSGGTPTAFSGKKPVITINFTAKAKGSAAVSVSKGSVLAADGKGTDVYKDSTPASFTIGDAAPAAADTSSTDTSASDGTASSGNPPPLAPVITSTTDPKTDSWYGTTTAQFNWILPDDAIGIRTLFTATSTDVPKTKLKTVTSSQTITNITDGVWYFMAQLQNDGGWGDVATYKVQIDTVPPNDFDISLQPPGSDGTPAKLVFKTDDALSGVDHYELIFGSSSVAQIKAADIGDGGYTIPAQAGGPTLVTVKAYDKATNIKVSSKTLTLPAVAAPTTASSDSSTPVVAGGASIFEIILMILLGCGMGGVIVVNMYLRKQVAKDKSKLLQAVLDVRDKNDRIFSAMREEFEQMINNFDEKPQLTSEERDLLEGIKEVLEVSEELVDTSLEDLKKMLRSQ